MVPAMEVPGYGGTCMELPGPASVGMDGDGEFSQTKGGEGFCPLGNSNRRAAARQVLQPGGLLLLKHRTFLGTEAKPSLSHSHPTGALPSRGESSSVPLQLEQVLLSRKLHSHAGKPAGFESCPEQALKNANLFKTRNLTAQMATDTPSAPAAPGVPGTPSCRTSASPQHRSVRGPSGARHGHTWHPWDASCSLPVLQLSSWEQDGWEGQCVYGKRLDDNPWRAPRDMGRPCVAHCTGAAVTSLSLSKSHLLWPSCAPAEWLGTPHLLVTVVP